MVSVMISKWVGDAVGGTESIYELLLSLNGYPYLNEKQDEVDVIDQLNANYQSEQFHSSPYSSKGLYSGSRTYGGVHAIRRIATPVESIQSVPVFGMTYEELGKNISVFILSII